MYAIGFLFGGMVACKGQLANLSASQPANLSTCVAAPQPPLAQETQGGHFILIFSTGIDLEVLEKNLTPQIHGLSGVKFFSSTSRSIPV